MHTLEWTFLALLATASNAAARGEVTVFAGAPGQPGPVLAYDEITGAVVAAPPELGAVELLPIEAAGRTALEEFLPGKARRLDDIEGASRLVLPARRGSLYHYTRAEGSGRVFGYFVVTRTGSPRVAIERPGIGAGGAVDPFLDRVAVAPDGQAFLCATKTGAGGDLLEVRSGANPVVVIDRTAGAPPVRIGARGLALTDTHLWALTGRGVARGSRAGTAIVQLVGYGGQPSPSTFQGDLVTSEHGTAVAFHAGASATQLDAWTATNSGPARRASTAPGLNTDAGFLPEAVDGPYLAVSDDGDWCAWRGNFGIANDCIVARAAAPAGEAQEILTASTNFTDTLDEVAVFFFRGPTQLLFGVGEKGVPLAAGIEGVDLFRATLSPGTPPAIANVTGTSGDFTQPFLSIPTLKPTRWTLSPDRRSLLMHDDSGSHGDVLVIDTATGAVTTVIADVKSFDWVELAGVRFAFGVQRGSGEKRHELYSMASDLSGAPALSYWSSELEPTRATTARSDGVVAWLRTTLAGDVLQRVQVPLANVETWGPAAAFPGGQGWTSGGSLTFESAGAVWLWPVGGGTPTSFVPASSFQVLPGA